MILSAWSTGRKSFRWPATKRSTPKAYARTVRSACDITPSALLFGCDRVGRPPLWSTSSPGCCHRPEARRLASSTGSTRPRTPGNDLPGSPVVAGSSLIRERRPGSVDWLGRVILGDARLKIVSQLSRCRGEPFPRPHGHPLHVRARSGMSPAVERRDDETEILFPSSIPRRGSSLPHGAPGSKGSDTGAAALVDCRAVRTRPVRAW